MSEARRVSSTMLRAILQRSFKTFYRAKVWDGDAGHRLHSLGVAKVGGGGDDGHTSGVVGQLRGRAA